MYIEFSLPTGAAGQGALYANQAINRALQEWSDLYDISFNSKNIKFFKRVTFDNDAHYAFFAMTWNPTGKHHSLSRWRIVSDLNNKNTFDPVV